MVELVVLKYTKVSIIISIAPGEYRSLSTIATSRENKGYQLWIQGGNRDVVLGVERRDVSRYVFSTIKFS